MLVKKALHTYILNLGFVITFTVWNFVFAVSKVCYKTLESAFCSKPEQRARSIDVYSSTLFTTICSGEKKPPSPLFHYSEKKNWKKGWKKFQMSALSSHLFVTTRSLCHGIIINPHQHPPFLFSMEFFLRHHLLRYSSWKSVYITRSHVSLEGRRTIFCKNELTFPSGSNGSQCISTSELLSLAISKNRPLPNCLFFPWNGPTIKG